MLLHVHVGCEAQPSAESGFPLSEFLKERHFKLSRNATMVAQQAANKIASENKVQYIWSLTDYLVLKGRLYVVVLVA